MILKRIWRVLRSLLLLLVFLLTVQGSVADTGGTVEQVRAYTRTLEFDYVSWMADALALKASFGTLHVPDYLSPTQQHQVVMEHFDLLQQLNDVRSKITVLYSDPAVKDPQAAAAGLLAEQSSLTRQLDSQQPLVEAIIQSQVSTVAAGMGLSLGGQLIPPLLYHITPLPMALIVSPRNVIQQVADISVSPDMPLTEITRLEDQVSKELNVSALVLPVGGVGVYPTMVTQTTDLNWLVETIAHEWIHNYLTLRPVGASYYATPEMRTINETTANIAGSEIGREVILRFYPEFAPALPMPVPFEELFPGPQPETSGTQVFNFRAEMHTTRVTADALLAEGKIDQAEAYMEARRQFFWDHGYLIRKLNQAYFAFNGSYADQPGGAAGKDPVGAAVRILRAESLTLAEFLHRLTWVTSFPALQKLVEAG